MIWIWIHSYTTEGLFHFTHVLQQLVFILSHKFNITLLQSWVVFLRILPPSDKTVLCVASFTWYKPFNGIPILLSFQSFSSHTPYLNTHTQLNNIKAMNTLDQLHRQECHKGPVNKSHHFSHSTICASFLQSYVRRSGSLTKTKMASSAVRTLASACGQWDTCQQKWNW